MDEPSVAELAGCVHDAAAGAQSRRDGWAKAGRVEVRRSAARSERRRTRRRSKRRRRVRAPGARAPARRRPGGYRTRGSGRGAGPSSCVTVEQEHRQPLTAETCRNNRALVVDVCPGADEKLLATIAWLGQDRGSLRMRQRKNEGGRGMNRIS